MRTPAYLCLLLTCMLISCTPTQRKHEIDYTSYVNPFIGTDFTGNTYPGAQAPFGMVQLSPDNGLPGWDRISGYFYPDSTIAGFSHTHLSGTGAGDLYDISFMPVTLPYKEAEAPCLASTLNSPTKMKVLMPVIIKYAWLIITSTSNWLPPSVVVSNVIRFRKPNLLSS